MGAAPYQVIRKTIELNFMVKPFKTYGHQIQNICSNSAHQCGHNF